MGQKEEVLDFFRQALDSERETVNSEGFVAVLSTLDVEASLRGLTEEEIDLCVTVLIKKRLGVGQIRALIQCMVPVTTVSKAATKNMLCWIFTKYRTFSLNAIVMGLHWLIGLIDNNLTDESMVDGFYHMYYMLLRKENLERHACRLIYLLTKPDDVSRWRVQQILQLREKLKVQHPANALLSLFKSYKPELVPETVPALSVSFAFGKLPQKLEGRLQAAAKRKQAAGAGPDDWLKDITWNTGTTRGTGIKKGLQLIPQINYIHFGSALYREEKTRSILEFNNMEELGCHQLSLDMPCNLMSLIGTQAGCHILTFASSQLQSQFSYALYYTLYNVFITKQRHPLDSEKENLLQQVYVLEQYMLQGIPVVSRFLAEFMPMWSGSELYIQIFQLLEWITFSSFDELYDCILTYIRTLFVVSNITVKCVIIRMLGRMMRNVILVKINRKRRNIPNLFLAVKEEEWDDVAIAQAMSRFVTKLCVTGIQQEPDSCMLLHGALSFYEMIANVEVMSGLHLWSIMPPAVAYRGLFTYDALSMSRVCALLLRYKNTMYPRVRMMGYRMLFVGEKSTVERYIIDFMNCLWNNLAFKNRENGYIFKDLPSVALTRLGGLVKLDEALNVTNHSVFASYIYSHFKSNDICPYILSKKDVLDIISDHFPDIINFITSFMR